MPELDQGLFERCFAAEVFEGRIFCRVCDADMNDAFDPGSLSSLKQGECVGDGVGVFEELVIEPDPIGIVKDIRVTQGLRQFIGAIKA